MSRLESSKSVALLVGLLGALYAPSALACNFCMLGQGVSPYLLTNGRGLMLETSYIQSDQVYNRATSVPTNKKEGWLTEALTGFYGVTPELTLSLTLPFAVKSNVDFNDPSGDYPNGVATGQLTNGFGDITLSARYTLLSHHTMASTLIFGLVGGVKMPTGSTKILDFDGGPVDRHVLPGTGSFDIPIGFSSSYSFAGQFQVTADAVYSFAGVGNWNGQTHQFGNSLNFNVKGYYKIMPSIPGPQNLFVYAGLAGESIGKEKGAFDQNGNYQTAAVNGSTGGTSLFWNLGIYATTSADTVINLGFSKAFYHLMNFDSNFDTDPAENYKMNFSFTYLL